MDDRVCRCRVCGFVAAAPRKTAPDEPRDVLAFSPLAPGTVLRERYKLIEPLGRGAHGLTFFAEHLFLNHPCVVKLLPQRIHDDSDAAVRRLRTEASAGYAVNHPNVVRVLDCDVVDGLWYFVMEFVDGVDLDHVAQQRPPIDWRQGVRWALDAAEGLRAIHSAGLVHRDIKPANLLLGLDGRVRVADLGVVRVAHDQSSANMGAWADRAGTLAYTAPEVLDGEGEPGPAGDLYALGATLFHLLTGRTPYAGAGLYERLLRARAAPA
ncbi:MAG: serine/threonine protein kinase, partial [Planctomycetota bacterium]